VKLPSGGLLVFKSKACERDQVTFVENDRHEKSRPCAAAFDLLTETGDPQAVPGVANKKTAPGTAVSQDDADRTSLPPAFLAVIGRHFQR
jgi:hypothetical protein